MMNNRVSCGLSSHVASLACGDQAISDRSQTCGIEFSRIEFDLYTSLRGNKHGEHHALLIQLLNSSRQKGHGSSSSWKPLAPSDPLNDRRFSTVYHGPAGEVVKCYPLKKPKDGKPNCQLILSGKWPSCDLMNSIRAIPAKLEKRFKICGVWLEISVYGPRIAELVEEAIREETVRGECLRQQQPIVHCEKPVVEQLADGRDYRDVSRRPIVRLNNQPGAGRLTLSLGGRCGLSAFHGLVRCSQSDADLRCKAVAFLRKYVDFVGPRSDSLEQKCSMLPWWREYLGLEVESQSLLIPSTMVQKAHGDCGGLPLQVEEMMRHDHPWNIPNPLGTSVEQRMRVLGS